jgi:hypothetical protein
MLRRLAIAIPVAIAALIIIDRLSLLIAPCEVYGQQYNAGTSYYYECAPREGIIIAGVEWLANLGPEVWTALATFAIAAFTGTLWWSTRGMLRVTNRSIDLARDEFRATHRPKIRLKHLQLVSDIWTNERIIVNPTFVNRGTANARLNTAGLRFVIVRADRAIPFDPAISANIPQVAGVELGTAINLALEAITDGTVLTNAQNTELQNGTSKLYCVGFISYFDAADQMRITGFCRVLTVPANALARTDNCRFLVFNDPDYEYED